MGNPLADIVVRDLGHGLNAATNLYQNGSLHGGTGSNIGKALVNYTRQDPSAPGALVNLAGQNSAPASRGATGSSGSSGSSGSAGVPSNAGSTTTYDPYGTGNGGSGNAAAQASNIAAYNGDISSLQNLLAQADVAQNNGMDNYNKAYNNGLAGLNQSQSDVLSGYATQRDNSTTGYQKNLQNINNNARNGYNSLQALLGNAGSAATILAPYAVSQQASQQRQGAQSDFAQNIAGIDTATKKANTDYQTKLTDLSTQKNSGIQKLISDINAQKQNYLSQIAGDRNQVSLAQNGNLADTSGLQAQIAALQAQQNGLAQQYATPTLTVAPVTADPVNLQQYQAQAAQIAANSNAGAPPDDASSISGLGAFLKQNQNSTNFTY